MKRLRVMLLALVLCAAPVSVATAYAAPFGVELAAAPIVLAQAAAPLELGVGEATVVEAPPVTSWNPSDWFGDALILGGVVAALVALIKANFLKNLQGLQTVGLSFALGIGISLLGTINWPVLGRPNELSGMAAVMFGVNASVIASGGWDLIRGLLMAALSGKSRSAEAST